MIAYWKHLHGGFGIATCNVFLATLVRTILEKKMHLYSLIVIDIVYAVAYSLLLLNTDLHVAQGNHARMTRQAFVRNTMSTIEDQLRMLPPEKRRGHLFTKTWEADMEICLKVNEDNWHKHI